MWSEWGGLPPQRPMGVTDSHPLFSCFSIYFLKHRHLGN
jgi:hypothetical protein